MDNDNFINIYILVILILIIYINFVVNWISKKEYIEYFMEQCKKKYCDVELLNSKLNYISNFVSNLENRIITIEKIIIQNGPIKINEHFFLQNNIKNNAPLSTVLKLENECTLIYNKQIKIKNLLNDIYLNEKNVSIQIQLPEKNNNNNNSMCFKLSNCNKKNINKMMDELDNIYLKIDEIKYKTNNIFEKLEQYKKEHNKMIKNREKTIKNINISVNDKMSRLLGRPIDMKTDEHLKRGIDKKLAKNVSKLIKQGKFDKIEELMKLNIDFSLISNKDRQVNNNVNLDELDFNLDEEKYKKESVKLVQNNIKSTKDEEKKNKATNEFGKEMDKLKIPKGFIIGRPPDPEPKFTFNQQKV
jgi:hypothetical protein